MSFLPLTLTLSPKGRGEITFDNTIKKDRRKKNEKVISFVISAFPSNSICN